MHLAARIKPLIATTLSAIFEKPVTPEELTIDSTKPEFEGDYTLVLFGLVKKLKIS